LKAPRVDWITQGAARRAVMEQAGKEGEKKKEVTRVQGAKASHKLEDYVGDYEHPGYGVLKVALRDGKLEATFNNIATPLYPVVVFSFDTPLRPEPSSYRVEFPGFTVLEFNYRVIQLNRLDWRDFINHQNPVASALMSKMRMKREERRQVKLECLRLMLTMKLNPAKMQMIAGFVNTYLRLSEMGEKWVVSQLADALREVIGIAHKGDSQPTYLQTLSLAQELFPKLFDENSLLLRQEESDVAQEYRQIANAESSLQKKAISPLEISERIIVHAQELG
jgi:Domain of unknown function (DUF3471)